MATLKKNNIAVDDAEETVVDEEFTEKETNDNLRMKEDDFIAGMLAAATDKITDTTEVVIKRNGKRYFSFHVHALGEAEANACRKKYTKYVRNKSIGVKFADETDNAKFRSSLIYHATTDEDRAKYWDNKRVWNGLSQAGFQIINALDVIEAVLAGGEKDRVIDVINEISGFETENTEEIQSNREETTKN